MKRLLGLLSFSLLATPVALNAQPDVGVEVIEEVTQVQIFPGRASAIQFPGDEVISYILLADQSKIVYTTNAPLETGLAQVVFLRLINPLYIPGTTSPPESLTTLETETEVGQIYAPVTNLSVVTVDELDNQILYVFNLVPNSTNLPEGNNGVELVLATAGSNFDLDGIQLIDLQVGLELAIEREYTEPTDPIVRQLRQLIEMAIESERSIEDIADELDIADEVIVNLVEIAQEEN